MRRNTILVIDDEPTLGEGIQAHLQPAGYQVNVAVAGQAALALVDEWQPKLVITDLRMPGMDGIELLRRARDQRVPTTVVITTALPHIESALETLHLGAYDYVTKPIDYSLLALVVRRAMERQTLLDEVHHLRSNKDGSYEAVLSLPEKGLGLEEIERELLVIALQKFRGNQTQAARYLNISRRTLIYRMEKHHLRS